MRQRVPPCRNRSRYPARAHRHRYPLHRLSGGHRDRCAGGKRRLAGCRRGSAGQRSRNANSQAKFLRFLSGSVLVATYSTPVEYALAAQACERACAARRPATCRRGCPWRRTSCRPARAARDPICRRSRVNSASPPDGKWKCDDIGLSLGEIRSAFDPQIRRSRRANTPRPNSRGTGRDTCSVRPPRASKRGNRSGKLRQAGRRTQHAPRRHLRHSVDQQRFLGIRRDFATHNGYS